MKASSRKDKGRKLQKWVAARLTELFHLGAGDCESRPIGSAGTDVMMSAKARNDIEISYECKSTRAPPSRAQLEQSRANKHPGTLASVVWKPHGHKYENSMILFDFNEFHIAWINRGDKDNESD
jgi:hypothetical protein